MTMEVFGGGQLGAEVETIKQTARGRLDAGNFFCSRHPLFSQHSLLFPSYYLPTYTHTSQVLETVSYYFAAVLTKSLTLEKKLEKEDKATSR